MVCKSKFTRVLNFVRILRPIFLENFSHRKDLTKKQKSATLIELIILVLVVAIIGAVSASSVILLVQLFMYSPRQLDTQKIAQELTNVMIEGNQDIRGMRYAKSVIDASATRFSYTYGYPTSAEQLSVRFRYDDLAKRIYRSTSSDGGVFWTVEVVVPYYLSTTTFITGKNDPSVIFIYKKADDNDWLFADGFASIRRVVININVKTGTGIFSDFEGSCNLTSSVEIKSF